ncbi:MAG: glycosyltransferase [Bacteroidetes bacterium]|nr:glycosyltransferase [Bacteroidota bacterium]
MTQDPQVVIVILNYNTIDLLKRFLSRVKSSMYADFKVVVADNGSTDGSAEYVRSYHPTIKLIELDKNYGFAGGYNKALEQVDGEYWILLNSDVKIDLYWITPMIDIMLANPNVAAVQPKIMQIEEYIRFEYAGAAGGFMDKFGYPFCQGRIFDRCEIDLSIYNEPKQIFWATGAAMLIRSNDFREAGGFDDHFFAHMEEIDLCWRLQNIGREVWICPDAKVYHIGGGTLSAQSSRKTFLNFRNNIALLYKNLHRKDIPWILFVRLILDGVAGLKYVSEGKFSHCWAIARAHFDFYRNIRYWNQKRREILVKKRTRDLVGWLDVSIVWQFFVKKRKEFYKLPTWRKLYAKPNPDFIKK